jgi:hypothetical protein
VQLTFVNAEALLTLVVKARAAAACPHHQFKTFW